MDNEKLQRLKTYINELKEKGQCLIKIMDKKGYYNSEFEDPLEELREVVNKEGVV